MHVIAAKAVSFKEALSPHFKTYMENVVNNAQILGEALKKEGIRIVSGGTDNHLLLLDVTPLHLTGKQAEEVLDQIGITTNKNKIHFYQERPKVTEDD